MIKTSDFPWGGLGSHWRVLRKVRYADFTFKRISLAAIWKRLQVGGIRVSTGRHIRELFQPSWHLGECHDMNQDGGLDMVKIGGFSTHFED